MDGRGALWVLDPAAPGNEKILPGGPKLVRVDLATDQVTKTILFDETVALQGTYLNGIRFSADSKTGYITDSGTRGAIIVVDLDTGDAFRALDGHKSTQVVKDVIVEIDGKPLRRPDGRQPSFSSDSLAISNDREALYWSRRSASASQISASAAPSPYISAVSTSVMPNSTPARSAAISSDRRSARSPIFQVP